LEVGERLFCFNPLKIINQSKFMKSIPLFIAAVISLFTVVTTQAVPDLKADLKNNPDKIPAYNNYIRATVTEIRGLMSTKPDAAEKKIAEMEAFLKTLKPTNEQGKTFHQRSLRSARFLKQNLELERTPIEDYVKRLKDDPDDIDALRAYYRKASMKISPITRSKPDQAEKELKALQTFLDGVKAKAQKEATGRQIEGYARGLTSMKSRIVAGRKLVKMIGQDATPLKVSSWANGDPVTDKDLNGKVVLLDFWAVWCGPCIATFPHLREWQEKYSGRGLVIIGMTRHYNYEWNAETGRASRAKEPTSPEEEGAMLEKFAKHHKLHHRFAIQDGRDISTYYGVTGIPHVVLIDQKGKIRLMRVGSGEQNAKDVEAMIKKLLGPDAAAAGS